MPGGPRPLTDDQFERLRSVISERSGVWFSDVKRYILELRLQARLEEVGVADFEAYLRRLADEDAGEPEMRAMLERIVTDETSFFRHPEQFEWLERVALPSLLESRGRNPIHVLCAGCSSGEEAYSVALLMRRVVGAAAAKRRIRILGVDLSERALAQAREATFSPYSVCNVDASLLAQCFRRVGTEHTLRDAVRELVRFERWNLADPGAWSGRWDLILCRNVLTHLDERACASIASSMERALAPDGWLLLGPSESLADAPAGLRALPNHVAGCHALHAPGRGAGVHAA